MTPEPSPATPADADLVELCLDVAETGRRCGQETDNPRNCYRLLRSAATELQSLRDKLRVAVEGLEKIAPMLDYLPHPQCVETIEIVRETLATIRSADNG